MEGDIHIKWPTEGISPEREASQL